MRRLSLDAGGGGCRPGVVTVFQMFRKGGTIYAGPAARGDRIKRSRFRRWRIHAIRASVPDIDLR
jgi:hypothetical protein